MKCRQFIEKPRQVEKPYQKRCGTGWGLGWGGVYWGTTILTILSL